MKAKCILSGLILAFWLWSPVVHGQDQKTKNHKLYFTQSTEWIFSTANLVDQHGAGGDAKLRFSPVFNSTFIANRDLSDHFGIFFGMTLRNTGFVYLAPSDSAIGRVKKKFRIYSAGIPIGIKIGQMNGHLFYLGYSPEIALNYKEKTFIDDSKKDKFDTWFSNRTTLFQQRLFLGVQTSSGVGIQLNYYLSPLLNTAYTEKVNGVTTQPYQNIKAHVLGLSLNFNLFRILKQKPLSTHDDENTIDT